jgi:hypothetical protein
LWLWCGIGCGCGCGCDFGCGYGVVLVVVVVVVVILVVIKKSTPFPVFVFVLSPDPISGSMSSYKKRERMGKYPQPVYDSIIKWKTQNPSLPINDNFLAKVNNDCTSNITVKAIASWWIRYKGKTKPKLDCESIDDGKVEENEANINVDTSVNGNGEENESDMEVDTSVNGKDQENVTDMDVETSVNGNGEENDKDMDVETSHIHHHITNSFYYQELLDVKVDCTAMSRALRSPSVYPILLT